MRLPSSSYFSECFLARLSLQLASFRPLYSFYNLTNRHLCLPPQNEPITTVAALRLALNGSRPGVQSLQSM